MTKAIVYKFGGASIKDAQAIKNLSYILFNRLRSPMVIVVSAIGKTTNALEEILSLKMEQKDYYSNYTILRKNHLAICEELFEQEDLVFGMVNNIFLRLATALEAPLTKENYDEYYDRVIGYGELLSSKIIQAYLCHRKQFCIWQDAREFIKTDGTFRLAKVDWESTLAMCRQQLIPVLKQLPVVTQGFVGSTRDGKPTTLGREGSDFSAAIFAKSLGAASVTIWKDVPGVLNADPKRFKDTIKLDRVDYKEAAEMTFYGASVIHPRTIKPLANNHIPLYVKSFLHPEDEGTVIGDFEEHRISIPSIVVKDEQILVTFEVTDFTFINESHMHQVYAALDRLKLRANLIQASAITISICMDRELFKLEQLLGEMKGVFKVRYNEGVQLITVKNYDEETKAMFIGNSEVLLEQTTRSTFQLVCRLFDGEVEGKLR
ncbi:aspartate kinase [Echinicola strongylocentroti]|uniref:Aspartokinase n=1 Tax=Echinicola strongylocentroti TaxID=1795355 RepID=A0A2Z4IKT1_9BACT|nr:aspartate kinase [Echinicola strongylocentroti]AWW31347.1 aspartate kinase [Echinicola strongylocentroti]